MRSNINSGQCFAVVEENFGKNFGIDHEDETNLYRNERKWMSNRTVEVLHWKFFSLFCTRKNRTLEQNDTPIYNIEIINIDQLECPHFGGMFPFKMEIFTVSCVDQHLHNTISFSSTLTAQSFFFSAYFSVERNSFVALHATLWARDPFLKVSRLVAAHTRENIGPHPDTAVCYIRLIPSLTNQNYYLWICSFAARACFLYLSLRKEKQQRKKCQSYSVSRHTLVCISHG